MNTQIDSAKFERLIFEIEHEILNITSKLQDPFSKLEDNERRWK